MWRNLISGVQFLTIIPCGPTRPLDVRKTLPLFPICGLIIGAILVLTDTLSLLVWEQSTTAVVDVVALAIVTGALHLDGLADTADGLYGQRPPETALAIMKDSRIGAMGMVAVGCIMALKWAGLSGIQNDRFLWLLIVPGLARGTVLFGVRWLPYGRPEGGTGQSFFQNKPRLMDHWALLLILLSAAVVGGWAALWATLSLTVLIIALLTYYRLKINCITGDMLGAMIEISETGLFLSLSAVTGLQ